MSTDEMQAQAPGLFDQPPAGDDLHGGAPAVAALDDEVEQLAVMPGLLEAVSPSQMALTVYGHMKELYALAYDREKNQHRGDLENILNVAANMLLVALDDRRLSTAMNKAAEDNHLFNSFAAAREFAQQGGI